MLGFSPLASAPLSDDGIVVVSSSISLSGVASQVIHNDVVGVNSSTKSITTISSVTDVNNVVGINSSTKSISNVSSQVTQGSLSTTVDITLSSTSTTGQLGTINRVVGVSTTLDSVSTASQVGTTSGSTSSNKAVTSVSATGSVNDLSASTSSNKAVTSVSTTGQVRTPQIGPSENLVAVSVTGNVTSPSLVVSSSVEINQVTSTSQVGSLVGTTDEIGELTSVSSTVSVSSVEANAESSETLSSLSSILSATDLSLVASSNKSLVNVSSSATVNSLAALISDEVSLSGVSSSVDVNDLPFVGVPVNATVNLGDSLTPNLYYSGDTSGGVDYTSSTQYQSSSIGVELYFKLDSNYNNSTTWLFDSQGYKSGWTNQRIYAYLNGNSISSSVKLGNQLGRTATSTFTISPSGGISVDTWYRLHVYQSGQRHYANLYDSSNNVVHSQSQLLTISYGSYTSASYQFFLDDFTVGAASGGSGTFQGLISNFSINAPVNLARSLVLWQLTTPTWAATGGFTDNATAADTFVFDSPFSSPHLVTSLVRANSATATFSSNVTAFPTGVSSSAQVQALEETLVSSSKTLDSTSSVAALTSVTQVHSSNKTLPSVDFTSSVNDVDKSVSSSVILDTTNSQASVTDLVSLTTDVLTGVSSSVTFNNLSVNLSTTLTTVTSTSQVSDLVVDIDEIIPPSLSVSSQVSVGQIVAGGGSTLDDVSTSTQVGNLSGNSTDLLQGVGSEGQTGDISTINDSSVEINSVASVTSISSQVGTNLIVDVTGVEAGTAVQFGGVESQEAVLRRLESPCQVGTLTINVSVTLPSASSAFNASDEVKGVINASVQLSTLPLVTVGRGSITLSTDGFNFEEFKNAYDRARTVYISRAA
jgi:hypothetical protein